MNGEKYCEMSTKVSNLSSSVKYTKDGTELGMIVENFLNGYNDENVDEFLEYMTNFAHRTLQQKFFGLVMKSILKFAEVEHYDLRNLRSVETAKKLQELIKENNIPTRMPLI